MGDPRPLVGVRVLELATVGPTPYAAMLLADLGAEVTRVERPGVGFDPFGVRARPDPLLRGRTHLELDLKQPADRATVLDHIARTDVLVEGFRPGVMERLGLGPRDCQGVNPALVYVRITGWGQDGPRAQRAGHDINYIGTTGALNAFRGRSTQPIVPLNLLGDYAGGSLFAVIGLLSALRQRETTGVGAVVDAAMVDGVTSMLQNVWSLRDAGHWSDEPASNLLDGGAPFYDTYRCSDGRFVAVGAIEPQFWAELVDGLGLPASWRERQYDHATWPEMRAVLAEAFARRPRDEWSVVFCDRDACVTPVLTFAEALDDPQLLARGVHQVVDGSLQTASTPRLRPLVPEENHAQS